MGQVITFYSYKGGVGRSMALANVAIQLVEWGHNVLLIAWDLEAPGLEFYFREHIDLRKTAEDEGLIDILFDAYKNGAGSFPINRWKTHVNEISFSSFTGTMHLLASGKKDDSYFKKVRRLDWNEFYENRGGYLIEELRSIWKKEYDYILVDSRTGVTDTGGICTIHLPDILVLLFTASEQSLTGIIDIAQKACQLRKDLPFDRTTLFCLPIPSRFDSSEEFKTSQQWLDRFAKDLSGFFINWLPASINRRKFLEAIKIPYVPYFSFGEKLPIVEQGSTDPTGLGYAYKNLANLLADKLKSPEQIFPNRDIQNQVSSKGESSTREIFPKGWALRQVDLGNAYRNQLKGNRSDNLEEAIAAYKRALQIFSREAFPQEWAAAQMNLGAVYTERHQGSKSENIEQAITLLKQSLDVHTYEAFPKQWALAQQYLADAYLNRVQGNPEENIASAILLYSEAAEVFTQVAYPEDWFRNQVHFAAAYLIRASGKGSEIDQLDDLNTAVTLLQEVLETANPEALTPEYPDAQYQLGTTLLQRYKYTNDSADLQQTLEAYTIALEAISPEHYNREKMWRALPEIQIILGSRLVRGGEWYRGLELLKAATIQLRSKDDLLSLANAYYETGIAYEVLGIGEEARIYYRDALRLFEKIDHGLGIAQSHHRLGVILRSGGYLTKAMSEFRKAQALYEKLGMSEEVAEVDSLCQADKQRNQEFERLGSGGASEQHL